MGLKTGDAIPDFALRDQDDNLFKSEMILGKKPVVIYFYPKNFTPACTKEACSFRDSYEDFTAAGAEVIGISSDSNTSHGRFVRRYDLPFTILSDTKGKVRKLFGVKSELLGLIPGRETFVIDADGKLLMRYNSMSPSSHIKKALNTVNSIKK